MYSYRGRQHLPDSSRTWALQNINFIFSLLFSCLLLHYLLLSPSRTVWLALKLIMRLRSICSISISHTQTHTLTCTHLSICFKRGRATPHSLSHSFTSACSPVHPFTRSPASPVSQSTQRPALGLKRSEVNSTEVRGIASQISQ